MSLREPHDVNCEDPGQDFEATLNPVFAMREISAVVFINSAKEDASNTAFDFRGVREAEFGNDGASFFRDFMPDSPSAARILLKTFC